MFSIEITFKKDEFVRFVIKVNDFVISTIEFNLMGLEEKGCLEEDLHGAHVFLTKIINSAQIRKKDECSIDFVLYGDYDELERIVLKKDVAIFELCRRHNYEVNCDQVKVNVPIHDIASDLFKFVEMFAKEYGYLN